MKNLKLIISILLVLIWMVVIFNFSHMPSDESDEKSKGLINEAIEIIVKATNEELSEDEIKVVVDRLNYPVRKVAHASVYFVLALFILNVIFDVKSPKTWKIYAITILICFLYAITDEYHQTFIAGRTGKFTDVLIDTLGASIACTLVILFSRRKEKNKVKTS